MKACVIQILLLALLLPGCRAEGNRLHLITREEGSGTRAAFVESLQITDSDGIDAVTVSAEVSNSTAVVLQTVATDPKAMGYVSLGALSGQVRPVSLDGVPPSDEAIRAGQYPLSRPFLLCWRTLDDLGQDFVAFLLSSQGQAMFAPDYLPAVKAPQPYAPAGLTGHLTVCGSTSVGPVMLQLAERYMEQNPGVSIDVQQTGSSAGIAGVIEGSCQLGISSRAITAEEAAQALTSRVMALDGIAVIVHPSNPVENLSVRQLRDIFLGEITSWDAL